jgi:hypothetical protein
MRRATSPSASIIGRPSRISAMACPNSRFDGSGASAATASIACMIEYPARSEVARSVRTSGSWLANFFRSLEAAPLTYRYSTTTTIDPATTAQRTEPVKRPNSRPTMIANPIAPMIASPGLIGISACSRDRSIIRELPRFSAYVSALAAARRMNRNRPNMPDAFSSFCPYALNRPLIAASLLL